MRYVFELQTSTSGPVYALAHGDTRDEALADVREELELDGDNEVIVLAVHTVH